MIQTGNLALYEGKPFGNIMMRSDYQEITGLGFEPGDSVNVLFNNGTALEDIPFLCGCILPEGAICLNAYPGFDWIRIEKRFGRVWEPCRMTGAKTARVFLNEHGKYKVLQDVFCTDFDISAERYPSDEVFTNYRSLSGGRIRKGIVYRSTASFDPINNNDAFFIRQRHLDRLLERDGIQFVLNMTCEQKMAEEIFSSGKYDGFYINKLHKEGKVLSMQFPIDFLGSGFRNMLAAALRLMIANTGPYLIQCRAGLDRTGFLCCILEALMGADKREITDDYMRSFECLVRLNRDQDREKYELLSICQVERILEILTRCESVPRSFSTILSSGPEILRENDRDMLYSTDNLTASAGKYLLECGMTPEEISELKRILETPYLR